jgi:hypothetical protein
MVQAVHSSGTWLCGAYGFAGSEGSGRESTGRKSETWAKGERVDFELAKKRPALKRVLQWRGIFRSAEALLPRINAGAATSLAAAAAANAGAGNELGVGLHCGFF